MAKKFCFGRYARFKRFFLVAFSSVFLVGMAVSPSFVKADTGGAWRGVFFNNKDLMNAPAGYETFEGDELYYDWGGAAPGGVINPESFSAKWTKDYDVIVSGYYQFHAQADDGVRVLLRDDSTGDTMILIDSWRANSMSKRLSSKPIYLDSNSTYGLTVKYYENGGQAGIHVWGHQTDEQPYEIEDDDVYTDDWNAEYYEDKELNGNPNIVRAVGASSLSLSWAPGKKPLNWGWGGFSAKFITRRNFAEGFYTFKTVSDDGVRVYIEEIGFPETKETVINAWYAANGLNHSSLPISLNGEYKITVEYYDNGGQSEIDVSWELGELGYGSAVVPSNAWLVERYANRGLNGIPVSHEIMNSSWTINEDWGNGSPAGLPSDYFSVRYSRRYSGISGMKFLSFKADDDLRIYINGRETVHARRDPNGSTYMSTFYISNGDEIVLEYSEGGGESYVSFGF